MPNFDEIEKNLEAMLKLATDKLQLLQGQYGGMSEEDKKVCAGRSTKAWAEFKEATKEFQAKHGLVWSARRHCVGAAGVKVAMRQDKPAALCFPRKRGRGLCWFA